MKKKLIDKILDALIEKSLTTGLLIISTVTGVTAFSIWELTKNMLNYQVKISVSTLLGLLFIVGILSVLFWYTRLKLLSKKLFTEGTKVILSTGRSPVMSAGKYNFLNNKVLCTWAPDQKITHEWVNQNLLKEYEAPSYRPPQNRSKTGYWNRAF